MSQFVLKVSRHNIHLSSLLSRINVVFEKFIYSSSFSTILFSLLFFLALFLFADISIYIIKNSVCLAIWPWLREDRDWFMPFTKAIEKNEMQIALPGFDLGSLCKVCAHVFIKDRYFVYKNRISNCIIFNKPRNLTFRFR